MFNFIKKLLIVNVLHIQIKSKSRILKIVVSFAPIDATMFRDAFVFIFFAFLSFHVFASERKSDIDSMANRFLRSENIDLKTFDLLFIELQTLYPEELAHLAENLLQRSIEKGFRDGIFRAHDAYGMYFISKGYHNQAFKLLLRAKNYYESNNMFYYCMKNYFYIAKAYIALGNLEEAILWMHKSKVLAELNPVRTSLYSLRIDLATVYFRLGRFKEGKALLDQNEKEWDQLTEFLKVTQTTLLGNYEIQLENYKEAEKYYQRANAMALAVEDPVTISNSYANLGILDFELEGNDSKKYFELSLRYAHLSNYSPLIARQYFNLASWHLAFNFLDSALVHFENSFQVAQRVNSYVDMLDALEEITSIHRMKKSWDAVDSLHQKIIQTKSDQYKELMQSFDDLNMFENLENFEVEQSLEEKSVFSGWSFWHWISLIFGIVVLIQGILLYALWQRKSDLSRFEAL